MVSIPGWRRCEIWLQSDVNGVNDDVDADHARYPVKRGFRSKLSLPKILPDRFPQVFVYASPVIRKPPQPALTQLVPIKTIELKILYLDRCPRFDAVRLATSVSIAHEVTHRRSLYIVLACDPTECSPDTNKHSFYDASTQCSDRRRTHISLFNLVDILDYNRNAWTTAKACSTCVLTETAKFAWLHAAPAYNPNSNTDRPHRY
ncbi:LOW QUALITY PROTEIN: hypothetical protein T265_12944 [Opisthorchis viverrini]|uniref:Uncharacterized protein n=1 Tax=Opisthorchis viverrini TaxID=6198 RepID=A0A074ZX89_OPIVI|nr:LOW QUALITY PROTEIN: hypothetical protein T265_12944 [Opisthorchis viverrini]KER31686.1 LOW QUALITY PROTEIN: hypothetical protein T265_12944 [Opisthorchis viverrini]